MDNFRILYRILRILEQAMDLEESDSDSISAEKLKVSMERWSSLMEMLSDGGYIKGLKTTCSVDGNIQAGKNNIRITLKGLEYLNENSFMKKAADTAKGMSDLIP